MGPRPARFDLVEQIIYSGEVCGEGERSWGRLRAAIFSMPCATHLDNYGQ